MYAYTGIRAIEQVNGNRETFVELLKQIKYTAKDAMQYDDLRNDEIKRGILMQIQKEADILLLVIKLTTTAKNK